MEINHIVFDRRWQFGNTEKWERLPLEAGTRGLAMDSRLRILSTCAVNCRLFELAIATYIVNCN
jgi:hypothetical protein